MIKNVLIPEKIGNYYLFPRRIIGFAFDAATVTATKLFLRGKGAVVEQVVSESLSLNQELSYEEKVGPVIKGILDSVGNYSVIHTAISSSQVIFKTIKLPFLSYKKIKMVVNYEVEPLLPFSLDDAVIDFIVTKQFPSEGSSEVIVAAAQKSSVANHIALFEQAGVTPQKIEVDLFSLYSLYKKVPAYQEIKGGAVLVDMDSESTRVAFIQDAQLQSVRVLPKGMNHFVKAVSRAENIAVEEAYKVITRFGVTKHDDSAFQKVLSGVLEEFWSRVQFTVNSFVQEGQKDGLSLFVLAGLGRQIAGFSEFVTKYSGVNCEPFQTVPLIANKMLKVRDKVNVSEMNLISLGVSLPSDVTQNFNLMPLQMSAGQDVSILAKQLATAAFFIVALFAALLTHSFLQVNKLRKELVESRADVVETLKDRFNIPEEEDFDEVVDKAESQVSQEENMWAPFSAQSQFLKYILELHRLDLEDLGFEIDRISIGNGQMTLKARVRDYPAVSKLEKELRRSKLFRYKGSVQQTDFTMKIQLNKNG